MITAKAQGVRRILVHRLARAPGWASWWPVSQVHAVAGVRAAACQPTLTGWPTWEQAREGYRARLRALREAGWQRVE